MIASLRYLATSVGVVRFGGKPCLSHARRVLLMASRVMALLVAWRWMSSSSCSSGRVNVMVWVMVVLKR